MVYGLRLTVYMIFSMVSMMLSLLSIYVSMCVYMIMIDNAYIELYIYPPTLQAKNMWYIKKDGIYNINNYIYTHTHLLNFV